jgi:S-DNA-T family DNA segregation ATPase FtsK/SpoIIIE
LQSSFVISTTLPVAISTASTFVIKSFASTPYEDIPHLLTPIINDPEKTISALKWAVNEMERRYKLLAEEKIKEIRSYNKMIRTRGKKIEVMDEAGHVQKHDDGTMPYIVIVVDEMADLMMMAKRDVEALVVRIAQKARAVGIHLVLATQRPSVDVITGLTKMRDYQKSACRRPHCTMA